MKKLQHIDTRMDENRRAQEHMLIKSKQQSQADTLDHDSPSKRVDDEAAVGRVLGDLSGVPEG